MYLKRSLFLVVVLFLSVRGITQPSPETGNLPLDTATVNKLLSQAPPLFIENPDSARILSNQALSIANQINYTKGAAMALKNIGFVYYYQDNGVEVLNYWGQSLEKYKEIKDLDGVANLYNNIGVVYYNKGDDVKALENYFQSLKYAEEDNNKFRMLGALNNIGGVYYLRSVNYEKALDYYGRALKLSEELGDKPDELGTICTNIGSIYFEKGDDVEALKYFEKALDAFGNSDKRQAALIAMGRMYNKEGKYDLALENHFKALDITKKNNEVIFMIPSLMAIGDVYVAKGDNRTALKYYKEAEEKAVEIQANHDLSDLYNKISQAYSKIGDYSKAFSYQTLFSAIKDTLYNIATNEKMGEIRFEYDLEKKQNEVVLLTKDNDLQAAKIKRQQIAKNAFMGGLVLVFIIAALIFRGYRIKVKTHKILDKQKNEIETLLLNILPEKVAKELQVKGYATPRYFEEVSVMFTDFKGFTMLADKMSPDELVAELDSCFIAFDAIIGKYNLEKIKTIGDSYMCAGGIPTPDSEHPLKIVRAGLEIQEYIQVNNIRRQEKGLDPWFIRIGINIGPVTAGVVGKKKYAYDIWGSTVNIASRMESSGEPGRVNISAATYELVKDHFACSYRGKITAKNAGEIDMYFVDEEIKVPEEVAVAEEQQEVNE